MGCCTKARGGIRNPGNPVYKGWIIPSISPISWKWGSQLTETLAGVNSKACLMYSELYRMFLWLTITPFGVAVEPEVYWSQANVSSVTVEACHFLPNLLSTLSLFSHCSACKPGV